MDNTTKQLFAGAQAGFAAASASQGGGGVWPDDGQHQVFVDRVEIQPNTQFRMGQGQSIPATTIKFIYTLCEDPDRAEPLTFPGAAFDIPLDPSAITADNQKKRFEISLDRLKGHIASLLCTQDPGDLGSALEQLESLLGQETAVVATIEVTSRQHQGRTYRTEFIKECISGPHMQAPA